MAWGKKRRKEANEGRRTRFKPPLPKAAQRDDAHLLPEADREDDGSPPLEMEQRNGSPRQGAVQPDDESSELETEQHGERTPKPKEITVVIDFGTSNSIVAVISNERLILVSEFADMPDTLEHAPMVPSLLQYDASGKVKRYGHEVLLGGENVLRWFKLLLTSDDSSTIRKEAEDLVNRLLPLTKGLTEDDMISHFLEKIFEGLLKQLRKEGFLHDSETCNLRVAAALPSQCDQVARERYDECLRRASEAVGFAVTSIDIYPESLAVARNCIAEIKDPGSYLLAVHDGGGGTTDFYMMLVIVDKGLVYSEEIYAPRYLDMGGEHIEAQYKEFIQTQFSDITPAELEAFMTLWANVLKTKSPTNWVVGSLLKNSLPDGFVLEGDFSDQFESVVMDGVLDKIVEYLHEEYKLGMEEFEKRKEQYRLQCDNIWDSLHGDRMSDEQRETYRISEAFEKCKISFVSSGGQSHSVRLCDKLKEMFPEVWKRSEKPRTGLVEGLRHLLADAKEGSSQHRARHGYGYVGWEETQEGQPGAERNIDLEIYEGATAALIIPPESELYVGRSYFRPGRETASVRDHPTWPENILIRRFTKELLYAAKEDPNVLYQAPVILTLNLPTEQIPQEHIISCHYSEDRHSGELKFNVCEYQVKLNLESDGLLAQVVIPGHGKVITETRCSFSDMKMKLEEL
ncbi:uncharacterized protein PV07_12586 [Cladophialophora immunda]|uniref:Uncharacterized protein n=1 Tax=Cladophialophora immunda TaxID=569365 RepID=A0A0D1Z341_9EURO|nr:uncharacterized protein PV07_12586 [Cladophialophora immunda]KIW22011.1 hypothetical protein PV07_12586 [Cladophialophora immunda]